jgi:hypothetical protein
VNRCYLGQNQNASNDSNQQNNQSSNSNSGQRTHVVNGQNLYRIAIIISSKENYCGITRR